jgi:hypothetical protein
MCTYVYHVYHKKTKHMCESVNVVTVNFLNGVLGSARNSATYVPIVLFRSWH